MQRAARAGRFSSLPARSALSVPTRASRGTTGMGYRWSTVPRSTSAGVRTAAPIRPANPRRTPERAPRPSPAATEIWSGTPRGDFCRRHRNFASKCGRSSRHRIEGANRGQTAARPAAERGPFRAAPQDGRRRDARGRSRPRRRSNRQCKEARRHRPDRCGWYREVPPALRGIAPVEQCRCCDRQPSSRCRFAAGRSRSESVPFPFPRRGHEVVCEAHPLARSPPETPRRTNPCLSVNRSMEHPGHQKTRNKNSRKGATGVNRLQTFAPLSLCVVNLPSRISFVTAHAGRDKKAHGRISRGLQERTFYLSYPA